MKQIASGLLVVFDGIDGVGKTTQANLLLETLTHAGIDTVISKEPTSGQWGKIIKSSALNGRLPLDKEIEYFLKDREEHIEHVIRPSLEAGKAVILDRYYYSTIAYQGARGANVAAIKEMLNGTAIKPDITFILYCDVYIALGRIRNSRGQVPNEFEKAEYLEEVQSVFLSLCETEPEIKKINAQDSIRHIHNCVLDYIIHGPLKQKLCDKNYETDCIQCSSRILQKCSWYEMAATLKPVLQSER